MLVLLDRDGVINQDTDTGVLRLEEFIFLPRAIEAIALLTRAGFKTAICTNQSAIGKGLMTEHTLIEIHAHMCREIKKGGGAIDAIYFASDKPDFPSLRRKPAPGMLREALQQFHADPARTPMVGDMLRDMEAARAAGCPRILTRSGKGTKFIEQGIPAALQPVTICDDLFDAAQHIVAHYAAGCLN